MAETTNYGLYVSSDEQTKFRTWREKVAGETGSNMVKIDTALAGKQDKLTGTKGQVVGFDESGSAVAQEAPESGGPYYAVCSTSANTKAKTASCSGFKLKVGAMVMVRFNTYNSIADATLNINDTGAKPIKLYGTTGGVGARWSSGAMVLFTYDGTNWVMENGTTASVGYYGVTKLSDAVDSTSTSLAATANAVRRANETAQAAKDLAENFSQNAAKTPVSDQLVEMLDIDCTHALVNLLPDSSFENSGNGWEGDLKTYIGTYNNVGGHTGEKYLCFLGSSPMPAEAEMRADTVTPVVGHIYYAAFFARGFSSNTLGLDMSFGGKSATFNIPLPAKWTRYSARFSDFTSGDGYFQIAVNTAWDNAVDDLMLIDLTEAFGAGGEPNQSWCDEHIPWTDSSTELTTDGTVEQALDRLAQADGRCLKLSGGTMTGALNVQAPAADANPATKKYVDDELAGHTHTAASIGAATANHTHTAASIGAAAEGHTHTAASIGAKASDWKPFHVGSSAPADTSLLWIDTTANTGGLKYHNGSTWVHVPVAYT